MTPLQRTKTALHSALLALGSLGLSWLSGCTAPPSDKATTQPTASSSNPSLGTAQGSAPASSPGTTSQPAPHSAVRSAGLQAQDVEIRKADLEDVFLDVMHKSEETGAQA